MNQQISSLNSPEDDGYRSLAERLKVEVNNDECDVALVDDVVWRPSSHGGIKSKQMDNPTIYKTPTTEPKRSKDSDDVYCFRYMKEAEVQA